MPLPIITVCVDKREQHKLAFTDTMLWTDERGRATLYELRPEPATLLAGDYCIKGYSDICIIERKGSLDELRANLFSRDRRRALKAFNRLVSSTQHPYVFLDAPFTGMFLASKHWDESPECVQDTFFRTMAGLGISLLWWPYPTTEAAKKLVGTTLVRLMWNHVVVETKKQDIKKVEDSLCPPSN